MRSLYITSVERHAGKTALCLGLGRRFQADGFKVGYLKPLSLQPSRTGNPLADEGAAFVKETLGLTAEPWELSPVVLTSQFLRERLAGQGEIDLMDKVKAAADRLSQGVDLLLLEGGGSLREGYAVGLPTPAVAAELGSQVLALVPYHDEVHVLDDALSVKARLGDNLAGILINRIPNEAYYFAADIVAPYLEARGLPVLGVLPEARSLAALTVEELAEALDAEILVQTTKAGALVENLTIGAMTTESALSRFRQQANQAVITGGDRADIQLAALETSTTCLILTGNIRPSALVLKQAKEFGVGVLLVRANTLEAVKTIEAISGKTRIGHPAKLRQFQELIGKHFNFERLYEILKLSKGSPHPIE